MRALVALVVAASAATVAAGRLREPRAAHCASPSPPSVSRPAVYLTPRIHDRYNAILSFTIARRERRWLRRARVTRVGAVTIEVFGDAPPMATRNFYAVCAGSHATHSGPAPHYATTHTGVEVREGSVWCGGAAATTTTSAAAATIYGDDFSALAAASKPPYARGLVAAPPLPNGRLNSQFVVVLDAAKAQWPLVPLGQVLTGIEVLHDVVAHAADEHWVCACAVTRAPRRRRSKPTSLIYMPDG